MDNDTIATLARQSLTLADRIVTLMEQKAAAAERVSARISDLCTALTESAGRLGLYADPRVSGMDPGRSGDNDPTPVLPFPTGARFIAEPGGDCHDTTAQQPGPGCSYCGHGNTGDHPDCARDRAGPRPGDTANGG